MKASVTLRDLRWAALVVVMIGVVRMHEANKGVAAAPAATPPAERGPLLVTSRPALPALPVTAPAARYRVAGRVVDQDGAAVPGIEVVFAGGGTTKTWTDDDGSFTLALPAGSYQAKALGDGYLAIGEALEPMLMEGDLALDDVDHERAEDEEVDDEVTPETRLVAVAGDVDDVVLQVEAAGTLIVRVVDAAGPVVGAEVRVLDAASEVTDEDGVARLAVAPGQHYVRVRTEDHVEASASVELAAGAEQEIEVVLTTPCIVSGVVDDRDGTPVDDVVIEAAGTDGDFWVATVASGGFRWVTDQRGELRVRARVRGGEPSSEMRVECRPGAEVSGRLVMADALAALSGVVQRADGAPAADAVVEVATARLPALRVHADGRGRWSVDGLVPGAYTVRAYDAAGRRVQDEIAVPADAVALVLHDLGDVDIVVDGVDDGEASISVDLIDSSCGDGTVLSRRVHVVGGHVHLERIPACSLMVNVMLEDHGFGETVQAVPGETVTVGALGDSGGGAAVEERTAWVRVDGPPSDQAIGDDGGGDDAVGDDAVGDDAVGDDAIGEHEDGDDAAEWSGTRSSITVY